MIKIIVATDFSPAAKHALRYILKATEKLEREIVVVNVVHIDSQSPPSLLSTLLESMKTKAYFDFQALSEDMSKEFGANLPISFHAEIGRPTSKLIEKIADQENADLIVVGKKGETDMEKVFLGSVAASTAMHSKYPVIVVPADCKIYPIEHIVDATDLYQDEQEFRKVMQFAALFNAKVSLLHIYSDDENTEKANIAVLNEGLERKYGLSNVRYISQFNKSIADGIEQYTMEQPTDLLVVFTHKRLFYERLFNPSISKELAFDSKVALLVLKDDE
jgi:nucleotide-binding universal stress UspA family protein